MEKVILINIAYLAFYEYLLSFAFVSKHHVTAMQGQNEVLQFSSSHPRDETIGMYRP